MQKIFLKPKNLFILALGFFKCLSFGAETLSPSGEELELSYETSFYTHLITPDEFSTLSKKELTPLIKKAAGEHFKHIFGIFQSEEFTDQNNVPADEVYGVGAPLLPAKIQILSNKVDPKTNKVQIKYKTQALFLIHKNAAAKWKKENSLRVPLIVDMPEVYSHKKAYSEKWVHCTDSDHPEPENFFYFYNPFRDDENCEELSQEPISAQVIVSVKKPVLQRTNGVSSNETLIPMNALLDANQNGEWYTLYFIQGFVQSFQTRGDDGFKLFNSLQRKFLKEYGFIEINSLDDYRKLQGLYPLLTPPRLHAPEQGRFIRTYFGEVEKPDGTRVPTLIRSILAETSFDERRITFADFWKEAWEKGDVIFYNGHSGLGADMSQENLNLLYEKKKRTPLLLNKNKTQVAYIDSCSSYSYYSQEYTDQNPNLSLMSNALTSFFVSSEGLADIFLDQFLGAKKSTLWIEFLEKMETSIKESPRSQENPTYLLNVKF